MRSNQSSSRSPFLRRARFNFALLLFLVVTGQTPFVASENSTSSGSGRTEGATSNSTTMSPSTTTAANTTTTSSTTQTTTTTTTTTTTASPCLANCPATQPRVPGLPDLPAAAADATVEAIKADGAASVPALRRAVGELKEKTPPAEFPIWRRGVAPATPPDGRAPLEPVPEGIVYEEYEVLSEIRRTKKAADKQQQQQSGAGAEGSDAVEAVWVPVSVARPSAASDPRPSHSPPSPPSTTPTSEPPPPPALFLFHATGSSRAKTRTRLLEAAGRGYVAFAPDARHHGTRAALWEECSPGSDGGQLLFAEASSSKADGGGGGGLDVSLICPAPATRGLATRELYEDALVASFSEAVGGRQRQQQRPYMLDNVFDFGRVLEWALSVNSAVGSNSSSSPSSSSSSSSPPPPPPLFSFDPSRIGATGISLGGFHATFLAILDERIAVAAPAIGVPTFSWGAGNGDEWIPRYLSIPKVFDVAARQRGLTKPNAETYVHVLNTIAPGLLGAYEGARSMPSVAPRPFLIAGGGLDPRNPLGGVELAFARMKKVYESMGAGDRVDYFLDPNAAHEYTPAMEERVNAWLDKWLKP